ncbi:MAG: hypothetical protein ACRDRH_16715 [Pseudonocardia sp.]
MGSGRITELRLTSFKSYRDIALDGARRDAGPVRGGIEGCPPIGSTSFELGVTIAREGGDLRLDVRIQVRPRVQILREVLTTDVDGRRRILLETTGTDPLRADIEAKVWNNNRGRNSHYLFRAAHLLTAQLPLRLGGQTAAERVVLEAANTAGAVLGGVFHLDPVPQLMRQYVPERDVVLRRNGETLSATITRLRRDDPARFTELVEVIKDLPEHEVRALEVGRGEFGEVMLALREPSDSEEVTVPPAVSRLS